MYTVSLMTGLSDPLANGGARVPLGDFLGGYLAGVLVLLLVAAVLAVLMRRRGHHRVHTLRWDRPAHMAERRRWQSHLASNCPARLCRMARH